MTTLASAICAALLECDPRTKVMQTRALVRGWRQGQFSFAFDVAMPDEPGRPERPGLLPPSQMPKRGKGGSERGRIALWHALAHIEFVAIDLALDMAGRFGEAIGRHLNSLGSHYGALPAHSGLWDAARETAHDVAARLAVVPMVLEARALDVTPATLERVRALGDERGAKILSRILDDEIAHVRFGSKHFIAESLVRGESPEKLWKMLVARHFRGAVKPPFNDSARLSAGLPRSFYTGVDC